jgi:hypothetical protein
MASQSSWLMVKAFLMVMPNGSKYWRYHYRFAGKQKTLALGVYPEHHPQASPHQTRRCKTPAGSKY